MTSLASRLLAIDRSLESGGIPHAFGGAIALAYCTEEPRGTRDIDINVWVPVASAADVLEALPPGVAYDDGDAESIERDGQARLWWDDTPVDLFFSVHEFHTEAAGDIRSVRFEGQTIAVLGCEALAVFKALYNRTRDWADIEAMIDASALDCERVHAWLVRLLGSDDPATVKFQGLFG